jgi:DNA-directed RNA polymerase specialized sigma24 family protein
MKYRAVAEILEIPLGGVRSLLARARLAVATALGEDAAGPRT